MSYLEVFHKNARRLKGVRMDATALRERPATAGAEQAELAPAPIRHLVPHRRRHPRHEPLRPSLDGAWLAGRGADGLLVVPRIGMDGLVLPSVTALT